MSDREAVARAICTADPTMEDTAWDYIKDEYLRMADAAIAALPPREVTVQEVAARLVDAMDTDSDSMTLDERTLDDLDALRAALSEQEGR